MSRYLRGERARRWLISLVLVALAFLAGQRLFGGEDEALARPTRRIDRPAQPIARAEIPRPASAGSVPAPVIPVAPASALRSSRSPSTISGTVRDTLGRPVPGATLVLFPLHEGGKGLDDAEAQEDTQRERAGADGRFSISTSPGDFALYAVHQGRASTILEPLSLSAGEGMEEIELTLSGSAIAAGIVVRADGSPVERAVVNVHLRGRSFPLQRAVRTMRDFRFEELPDGPVVISVWAWHGEQAQQAIERPTQDLVIRVGGPGSALRVEVRDERGAPVDGAVVSVMGAGSGYLQITDSEGLVRFEGMHGHISMMAEHDGASSDPLELDVVDGGPVQRLVLRPRASATGRLLDEHGTPVKARLYLRRTGGPMPTAVEPDENGGFQFDAIAAGTYQLTYVDPTSEAELPLREVSFAEPRAYALGELRLTAARHVRGQVLDADGKPAADAEIEIVSADQASFGAGSHTTDADGRFDLVVRGPVSLRASGADGSVSSIAGFSASRDEDTTLHLEAVGFVSGVVRGAKGDDVAVRCTGGLWHPVGTNGQFHLSCPAGSELELRSGGTTRSTPVEIEPDDGTFVELRW